MFLSRKYNHQRINPSAFRCNFMNINKKLFGMNLHEYQAQALLKKYNVPIPNVKIFNKQIITGSCNYKRTRNRHCNSEIGESKWICS
jgi:hypothetical protein